MLFLVIYPTNLQVRLPTPIVIATTIEKEIPMAIPIPKVTATAIVMATATVSINTQQAANSKQHTIYNMHQQLLTQIEKPKLNAVQPPSGYYQGYPV